VQHVAVQGGSSSARFAPLRARPTSWSEVRVWRAVPRSLLGELILQICSEPIPVPSSLAEVPAGFDAWARRPIEQGKSSRWCLALQALSSRALRHQIRAHFAAIGRPLAADTLYGGPEAEGLHRHALHAFWIAYKGDPNVAAFTARSPLPPDMAALVPEPG